MMVTALVVLKCQAEDSEAVIMAKAIDVSECWYFQRLIAKEFITFFARIVANKISIGHRHSVQGQEYTVHAYKRNGLCALGFMDDQYPVMGAFSRLNQVMDQYQNDFGDSWMTAQADSAQPWPYLDEALIRFQDPVEADTLTMTQWELDETKIVLHRTIESLLEQGENLESLVQRSSDLSPATKTFFMDTRRTNQCCSTL